MLSSYKINLVRKQILLKWGRTIKKQAVLTYDFGSPERAALQETLEKLYQWESEVPIFVGNEKIFSGDVQYQRVPHNHKKVLAKFYYGNVQQIEAAVKVAVQAQQTWQHVSVSDRAAIWKRCADILEKKKRYLLNAAIILATSKTCAQAEEDTCRLVDELRRHADNLVQISSLKLKPNEPEVQPAFRLRPLDGFVVALSPFNMIYTATNLALCPALMGNTVIWKPSRYNLFPCLIVYKALVKAGLPRGVISFVPGNSRLFVDTVCTSPHLAGISFASNKAHYLHFYQAVAKNLPKYRGFPRVVAECGGNSFHFVHESADMETVINATVHAAFEFSGQRVNSCSRLYVPDTMWPKMRCALCDKASSLAIGDPCDFSVFSGALINDQGFNIVQKFLNRAKESGDAEIICGGDYCKTIGYFIEPTVVLCENPKDPLMTEEVFGPVLCVHVYKTCEIDNILDIIHSTSAYAHSGAIFAKDDTALCRTLMKLRRTVSNIYINEKCTGSIWGHCPFGSKDLSGTPYYLLRWGLPQLIEETLAN